MRFWECFSDLFGRNRAVEIGIASESGIYSLAIACLRNLKELKLLLLESIIINNVIAKNVIKRQYRKVREVLKLEETP